jgi:RimJ/RimL family protein N-acetyltransferase
MDVGLVVQYAHEDDLEAVKALQNENLRRNLPESESLQEGFVTAEYSVEFLRRMHSLQPSVVGRAGEELTGYAIAVSPDIRGNHALLDALFDDIDPIEFRGVQLSGCRYLLCGQLCVKKGFRGNALSTKMYTFMKDSLSSEYEYLITEVASDNPRSLRAHTKLGFVSVKTTIFNNVEFQIVLWDWRSK